MKRIMKYMKQYTRYYIIAISALIGAIILDMYNPYLVKLIIDDVVIGGNLSIFKGALLALCGITVARAILGYIKEYLFDFTGSKITMDLRKDLFDHIQTLSFSFFDGNNTGELMSRTKEDAENIHNVLAFGAMLLIEQGLYFIIATIVLFALNWKLAIVSLITMPIIAWLAVKLEHEVGESFEKISDQRAVLNTTAQENLAGVRLVKSLGRERYEISKFFEENKKNYDLNVEQAQILAKYQPEVEFLSNVIIVLITSVGGYLVVGGGLSIGTLVAFSNYIYMLIWPMRMIGWLTNLIAQCSASLHKIERLFEGSPEIKSPERPVMPENFDGHVVFKNVSFTRDGIEVLKNINIDAYPGSTVAIMGMTGAGKSTLINLISRFYDCSDGEVVVDGVNVKDMDLNVLRSQISVVMQDTFLFSDTIEENITFGSLNAVNENLIDAAKSASAHDFIMRMSNGYATVIGERGVGLSGGQKQRISIARSLAKDCKILILDDATSALDMETEHQIQTALNERSGVTKFIIAHRVSAVMSADQIIILDNGEIAERGTHTELLNLKGKYYETYKEQLQGAFNYCEEEVG